ncbi:hypothetical protein ACYZTM_29110 [Pseudomonas sp. MDT2-39-1]
MTTAQSPENTVLVLDRPRVQGATQPVIGADIGISLVIYDLVIDGLGATVQVDPALSGTVDPGDVMELWLEGETTFLDNQIITDVNAITTLRIPKGRLHPDRFNVLFYIIKRGSQNIGTSEPLILLYNKIRPGLKDTRPDIDGHSELVVLLPDAIKNGVGADFVSAQVCVSYPYCRAYDTITLKCNGEIMTYKVGADEAPQPPNPGSADPITVCFTVTRAYLESAIRLGGKLDFSYTVTDQLGNTPDTDAVWSASQTVDEDLAGTQLPAALLREQLNDPGDDLSVIDLEKLRGNPLLLIILTTDARFQVGYTVNALYTATLNGQPDVIVRVSGTVEADEFGQKKIVVLEVPNDKVEAGYTVTVTYELFDGTTLVGRSRTATALVVGEATIELERPSIQQAPNNTSLDPLAAQQALTAIIPTEGLLPTDLLSVTWTGAPGTPAEGSHTTVPRPIIEIGFSIALPTWLIPFSLGKPITVIFTITRGSASAQPSKPLTLNVLPLVLGDAYSPKLKQAANNGEGPELHLKDLTAAGLMWFSDWPFIALGQYVWLTLSGTKANGDSYHQVIWAAPFAFTNQGWIDNGFFEALAPYAELMELKDGSTLTVEFKAALGRSQDEAQALAFPIRTYTVKALIEVRPEITSVKDPQSVEIPNGETTIHTSVTLSGTASAGQKVEIFDGPTPKGIADVGSNGIWTHLQTGLSVASHSFTAKALYGSGLVSTPPRTLTVATEVRPEITSVKDPQSVEIPNGETTLHTSVTLSGTATKDQKVEIFDGPTTKGIADVGSNGIWTHSLTGLSVASHSFTAKALYGSGQVSTPPRTLTVATEVRPEITSVKDPQSVEIPNGDITLHTNVTLSGTASKGQKVEIFDGPTTKGIADVGSNGIWTHSVTGLSVAPHSFTAKALYGSGQVSTPPRTLTVASEVRPEITSVKDPQNIEIPNGETTIHASVTLSGTASAGQKVEIFDGSTPKGIANVGSNGIWTHSVTGLSVASHSFTAKALYGSGQVSTPPRTLTVASEVRPEITSVKDPQNIEIPNGETTIHTSVTLSGTASAGQKVEIFDGSTPKGIANVGSNGIWTHSVTGLSVASHSFTAKALYGSGQVSTPPRTLTVTRELFLDPTPMVLNGFNISIAGSGLDWVLTGNDPAGTADTRVPTGGTPPFTYRSSHPNIASVDSNGRVRSEGNGTATITVSDKSNPPQTKSFTASSTNVIRALRSPTPLRYPASRNWINSVGGTPLFVPNDPRIALIRIKFRDPTGGSYQTGESSYAYPTDQDLFLTSDRGNYWYIAHSGATSNPAISIPLK